MAEEAPLLDKKDKEEIDSMGVPVIKPNGRNPFVFYPIMMIVSTTLGFFFGWGMHYIAKPYDKLAAMGAQDMGYLYLTLWLVCRLQSILQIFVGAARVESGIQNPDQYVYKTYLRDEPYVRMCNDEGPMGKFNRTQRGLDNMRETFPELLVAIVCSGYVYPHATLCCTLLFMVGAVVYQHEYAKALESRMGGFMIRFFAILGLNGMHFFATCYLLHYH